MSASQFYETEQDVPDIQRDLALLAADCHMFKVDRMVTVAFMDGGVDVRGMGETGIEEMMALLRAAQEVLTDAIIGEMRGEG